MRKRKKKEHREIVLLEKYNLNIIEALISKSLINLDISHDEFVSVNHVLRDYNEKNKEIKSPDTSVAYVI